MIRAVIAARSPSDRELLSGCLGRDPAFLVLAAAARGRDATATVLQHRPDIVLLDAAVVGPTADEVTRAIMAEVPTPIMILLRSRDADSAASADCARRALAAGALVIVEMPTAESSTSPAGCDPEIVSMVKAMAGVKVVRRRTLRATPTASLLRVPAAARTPRLRLVVIASSTGGPSALRAILSELPADFPAPVLVVQNMTRDFIGALVHWLDGLVRLQVRVAGHGDVLQPGTVYFAPDDWHLGVRSEGTAQLSGDSEVGGFRPSATRLFESAAREFGANVLAVVLTGMGDDGVAGLHAVQQAGGHILAQDEASSVVFGMPGEAARAGVVDEVLPIGQIGRRIIQLVLRESDVP